MDSNLKIAETIKAQIMSISNMALASWGARNFFALSEENGGLTFTVQNTSKFKFSKQLRIILMPNDTYKIELRNKNFKLVEEVEEVYCDMLVSTIDNLVETKEYVRSLKR